MYFAHDCGGSFFVVANYNIYYSINLVSEIFEHLLKITATFSLTKNTSKGICATICRYIYILYHKSIYIPMNGLSVAK